MKKLTVGLRTDELPIDQVEGSWRNALNKSVYQKFKAISNEDGADNVTPNGAGSSEPYPTGKKCVGNINVNTQKVLFFATTDINDSELGIIKDDGLYYPIIKDPVLDLNENYPVQGVFQKKFNNNTILGWVSRNTNPKILNIDCIPFEIDGSYAVVDAAKAKVLLSLFAPYSIPRINEHFLEVKDGQGSFTTGVIYPFVNYQLGDGTYTSYSKVYNGIPIVIDSLANNEKKVGGSLGGLTSGKGIQIKFDDVDQNFKKLQVGYIQVSNGITLAYLEDSFIINGSSVSIVLKGNKKTSISLDDVLVPNAVYDKMGTITTVQKALYMGDGEQISNTYNYQPYANLITVNWVRERAIPLNNVTVKGIVDGSGIIYGGNYQDSTRIFFDKTFKSGECYALYIKLNWKNGAPSKAFHIPGRKSGTHPVLGNNDKAVYTSAEIDSGTNYYRYQVFDTNRHITDTKGEMGFWENENEEYPVDPLNPTTAVHPDFANIDDISFANRKVRHHVFPDFNGIVNPLGSTVNVLNGSFADTLNYPTNLNTQIFGLEISNVNIPAEILNLVDSWEIFYAERDLSNMRVIGNDIYYNNRFHTFDLMRFKPGIFPNYLKAVAGYNLDPITSSADIGNFVDALRSCSPFTAGDPPIKGLSKFIYLGENTTVPINNANIADCIWVEDLSGLTTVIDGFNIISGGNHLYILWDICIFRRNVYVNFQTQKLISTGFNVKITSSGVQSTKVIYGGDVYINRHSFVDSTLPSPTIVSIIVESAANIGLRMEDVTQSKYFYPKYPNPTPSWYGYNADFNVTNIYNQPAIYYPVENCIDADITKFPQKIPFSLPENTENASINWRVFKINSYYDMVKDKGKVINLLGSNRTLYIQMEFALFIAEIKDSLEFNGQQIAALGVTDIFSRPPQEILPITEGYVGCQSQYACGLTKLGYHVIDRQQGRVFLLPNGGQIEEISNKGMYNFFKKYSQTQQDIDNPFIGMGYTAAYNQKTNSLVICKQDFVYTTVDAHEVITEGYSFTLSYNPELNQNNGGWVSFHSYKPNLLIQTRNGLFAIENKLFKIFKHNSTTLKCKFYDEVIKEDYIDVVFNEVPEQTKRFDNVNWISTVEKNGVVYKQETATHLIVYNDTQCSNKITLKNTLPVWHGRAIRNVEDTWHFNDFRDQIKDSANPFLDEKGELITSNININKQWFDKSKFISKFVIFRIINDNAAQKNLHISLVGSNLKKSDR